MHTFRQALRSQDFVLTAGLDLDARADRSTIIAKANAVAQHVDAIQVTESPGTRAHLSPLATASILLNEGIDPVVHMHCRDRNRLALRGDLLGAAALGVSSLLIMRGPEVPDDKKSRVKTVYDWGAGKLIQAANSLEDADFMLGSIATVFKPDRDWKPEKITTKVDGGVKFIQTQLCFDIDLLRHYMARLVAEKLIQRVSVVIGLAPVPSANMAQWLGKNLRGSVVPAKVVKRLRQAKDPEQEGIEICAELLREVAEIPGVSGTDLHCLGNPDAIGETVKLSGIRS